MKPKSFWQRLSPKQAVAIQILGLFAVFSIFFVAGKAVADAFKSGPEAKNAPGIVQKEEDLLSVNRLNILLLGNDARPGEKDARTDSMILVSIDRDTKKIALLSIPRDTLVDIEGHGKNKINAANQFGGSELARSTVEKLLGIEIPYYVKTNFNGFKDIVDTLGGVELTVDKRMYYPSENINLRPGTQKLNGANALAYVRFRHDALGDIARTQRQQKFLLTLAKEMMKPVNIIKMPKLIPQLMKATDTNLGITDAIFLARVASKLEANNMVSATLPGVFYNYKGVSYWKIDEIKTKNVLAELFSGVKVATIAGPDETVPATKTKSSSWRGSQKVKNYTKVDTNSGNNGTQLPEENGYNPGQQKNDTGNNNGSGEVNSTKPSTGGQTTEPEQNNPAPSGQDSGTNQDANSSTNSQDGSQTSNQTGNGNAKIESEQTSNENVIPGNSQYESPITVGAQDTSGIINQ